MYSEKHKIVNQENNLLDQNVPREIQKRNKPQVLRGKEQCLFSSSTWPKVGNCLRSVP